MNNAKWFWITAATLTLAACGGGGGDPPAPEPPAVVGTGAASDCFNQLLYSAPTTTTQVFKRTDDATTEQYTTSTSVSGPTAFNGHPATRIQESTAREGGVVDTVVRYVQLEGLDVVTVGTTYNKTLGGVPTGPETVETYEAPLPRDKSFTLQPGQSHFMQGTQTIQPGGQAAITRPFEATTYYLGQEVLTVQGVAYNTCKFQFNDTRAGLPIVSWYIKSTVAGDEAKRGLIARTEGRNRTRPYTIELVSGSIIP